MARNKGRCIVCSKRTSRTCEACRDGLDRFGKPDPTPCCTECEQTHKDDDKAICQHKNVRKYIYRSGEIVKAAFLSYRRHAFDLTVSEASRAKSDGKLHVQMQTRTALLYPFPDHMFNDDKDKEVLLTYRTYQGPGGFMLELLRALLSGHVKKGYEIELKMKTHRDAVQYMNGEQVAASKTESRHCTLVLEGADGEAYILDVFGSQFRQYSAVVPYKEYCDQYSLGCRSKDPLGKEAADVQAILEGAHDTAIPTMYDFRIAQIHSQTIERFNEAVTEWQTTTKNLQDVLKEPKDEYELDKKRFVEYTGTAVQEYVADWVSGGWKLTLRGSSLSFSDPWTRVTEQDILNARAAALSLGKSSARTDTNPGIKAFLSLPAALRPQVLETLFGG